MKVKNLIKKLSAVDQDLDVRVLAEKVQVTLGSSPAVDIEDICVGFDWNQGRVFLSPPKGVYLTQLDLEEYNHVYELKSLVCSLAGRKYAMDAIQNFVRKDKLVEKANQLGYSDDVVNQIVKLLEEF